MFTIADTGHFSCAGGITCTPLPNSVTFASDTWHVIWYESPTGHRFVGIKGDGDALLKWLKAVDSKGELLALVEEKWRWLNDNPMYKRAWGKLTRRELQRGVGVEEGPEHHGKLIFGEPAPKVVRKRRGKR